MLHFNLQVLQLLVLFFIPSKGSGCSQVSETVSAFKEEDTILSCFNSYAMDPKSCYRVKWTKDEKVILVRPVSEKYLDSRNVKWEANGNGQMSLFLSKLQKSDEGCYTCEIWEGWDMILTKNFSLKLKDCRILKSVKATFNAPVNLSCPVDESGRQRPSNISWTMQKGSSSVYLTSDRVKINRSSLTIKSVQRSDSGWYRCGYMLGKTQHCFEINLQVQAQEEEEKAPVITTMTAQVTTTILGKSIKEEASSEAVVATVITVIVVIAALIGLFVYYRRSTQTVTQHHADGYIPPSNNDTVNEVQSFSQTDSTYEQAPDDMYEQVPDDNMYEQVPDDNMYEQVPDDNTCTYIC